MCRISVLTFVLWVSLMSWACSPTTGPSADELLPETNDFVSITPSFTIKASDNESVTPTPTVLNETLNSSLGPLPYIYRIKAGRCRYKPTEREQTGFRVKGKVGIVTALHGIVDCRVINAVTDLGDKPFFNDLSIREVNIDSDIALLSSPELDLSPADGLETSIYTDDRQNDGFEIVGYPLGLSKQKLTTDIEIIGIKELYDLIPRRFQVPMVERNSPSPEIAILEIQSHLVPGHSGAPVLDGEGQLIGISNGGLEGGTVEIGWAIPWPITLQEATGTTKEKLDELQLTDPQLALSFSSTYPRQERPSLQVVDETPQRGIYLIEGSAFEYYEVGDDLVVYGEYIPGVEQPIALLRVVAKNPNSLAAQAVLVHADLGFEIRTRMRVDSYIDQLSRSRLIPSEAYAIGYLWQSERIRLRPNNDLKEGDILEALEPQILGEEIIDYLPFEPRIQMRVTSIGFERQVAGVQLVTGTWPVLGTIIAMARASLPTSTPTPTIISVPTVTSTPSSVSMSTSTPLSTFISPPTITPTPTHSPTEEPMNMPVATLAHTSTATPTITFTPISLPTATTTATPSYDAAVVITALNVRIGPGTVYTRIGGVSQGDGLKVIGQAYNCRWLKVITPNDIEGWVSGDANYITYESSCESIPTVSISLTPTPDSILISSPTPTNTRLMSNAAITLLSPFEAVLSGKQTFRWSSTLTLAENQYYELIFWKVGQDPMKSGFGPIGSKKELEATFDLDKVSDDFAKNQNGPQLESGRDYIWGVLLVEFEPDYRRLQYLGEGQQFRYERVSDSPRLNPPPPD